MNEGDLNNNNNDNNNTTLYDILGITEEATYEEIKEAYRKKIIKVHPDKNTFSSSSNQHFNLLQTAWETLREPQSRLAYNSVLAKKELSQLQAIQEVDLDELSFNEEDNSYTLPCRCGEGFIVFEDELDNAIEFINCKGCSLTIKLIYQLDDDEDDDDA